VRTLKSSMPSAQMSAGKLYCVLLTISGAIYDGVPQKTLSLVAGSMAMLKPKSMSLMRWLSLTSRFSSLMSRWTTFLWWQYLTASTTCLNIIFAFEYINNDLLHLRWVFLMTCSWWTSSKRWSRWTPWSSAATWPTLLKSTTWWYSGGAILIISWLPELRSFASMGPPTWPSRRSSRRTLFLTVCELPDGPYNYIMISYNSVAPKS
jgi:hypothetical protein